MLRALFNKGNKEEVIDRNEGRPPLFFYKDAAHIGEHGRLAVNSPKHGLVSADIAFAFAGVSTPPKLDLATMRYIWDEAQVQGFIPLELTGYGDANSKAV